MTRSIEHTIGLIFYYLMKGLIVGGFVLALVQKNWESAFAIAAIILLILLPNFVKNKYRLYFPLEFDLFIIALIFFALFLGSVHNYYVKFWWWDIALHAQSGFWMGILGFLLVYILNEQENIRLSMRPSFVALFAFTFSMTIGTMWEIFEFALDSLAGQNMQHASLIDTMWDVIVNLIGAALISGLGYLWIKKKTKFIIFDHSIKKFVRKNKHLFRNKNAPS